MVYFIFANFWNLSCKLPLGLLGNVGPGGGLQGISSIPWGQTHGSVDCIKDIEVPGIHFGISGSSSISQQHFLHGSGSGTWYLQHSGVSILGTQFGLAAFARFVSVDDRFSKIPDARNYFSQFYDEDGNFTGIPSQ